MLLTAPRNGFDSPKVDASGLQVLEQKVQGFHPDEGLTVHNSVPEVDDTAFEVVGFSEMLVEVD